MEKENKKGRGLFNIFDFVLIAVALALGALLILAGRSDPGTSALETSDEVTLAVEEVEQYVVDGIKVGDPVFDRAKKYSLGTIEAVEVGPFEKSVIDYENHRQIMAVEPDRYTVTITLASTAKIDRNGVVVDGGFEMQVGKNISLKLPGIAVYPLVVGIERVDE